MRSMFMKILKSLCVLSILLSVMTASHANNGLAIGTKLTAEELSKLQEVNGAGQSFKIVKESNVVEPSTRSASLGVSKTYVADVNGIVGMSLNTVTISDIPVEQVRSKAIHTLSSANSVKYFDHLNIISLQFKSFQDALEAQSQLLQLFPNATVSVPIQFSERKLR